MPGNEAIGLVVAQCALACRQGSPEQRLHAIPREALALYFRALSYACIPAKHKSPNAHPSNTPGYISITVGTIGVQIPFHLIDIFPLGAELEHLIHLAALIQIKSDSKICISGSSTFLGSNKSMSDIDFCEYTDYREFSIPQSAAKKFPEQKRSSIACIRIKRGSFEVGYPEATHLEDQAFSSSLQEDQSPWMINFVGAIPSLGVMPISNLILSVDPQRPDEGMYLKSWPFQEVLIGPLTLSPRTLDSPEQLGRYVLWLAAEIRLHKTKNPIKAVKRALSLARILQMSNAAKTMSELLEMPTVEIASAKEALTVVKKCVSGIKDPDVKRRIEAGIVAASASIPKKMESLGKIEINRLCRKRLIEFLKELDALFTKAELMADHHGKKIRPQKQAEAF